MIRRGVMVGVVAALAALAAGALILRSKQAGGVETPSAGRPLPPRRVANDPVLRGVGKPSAPGGAGQVGSRILLKVVDREGSPIAGADVFPRSGSGQGARAEVLARTDGLGLAGFALSGTRPGFTVAAAGHRAETVWVGSGDAPQEHVVVLESVDSVTVVVTSGSDDEPVEGAAVLLSPVANDVDAYLASLRGAEAAARTDARGEASLPWPADALARIVAARDPSRRRSAYAVVQRPSSPVRLRMEEDRSHTVRVADAQGTALARATARVTIDGRLWTEVAADASGDVRVDVPDAAPAQRVFLDFACPGYEYERLLESDLAPGQTVLLAPALSAVVHVQATEDDGPIAGAQVAWLEVGDSPDRLAPLGETDDGGNLPLSLAFGRPPNERVLWVVASAAGRGTASRMVGRPGVESDPKVVLRLAPARPGVVHVRGLDGRSIAGALVWITVSPAAGGGSGGGPGNVQGSPVRTDATGLASVGWTGTGDWVGIFAWSEGHRFQHATVPPGDGPWRLDLSLERAPVSRWTVLSGEGSEPAPHARATLVTVDGGAPGAAIWPLRDLEEDERGVLDLGHLPAGPSRVRFEADGHVPREVPFDRGIPPGGAVRLRKHAAVRGRIEGGPAGAFAGSEVRAVLLNAREAIAEGEQPREGWRATANPDARGEFSLEGLLPGGVYELAWDGMGDSTTKEGLMHVKAPEDGVVLRPLDLPWVSTLVRVHGLPPQDLGNTMVTLDVRHGSGAGSHSVQRSAIVGRNGTFRALLPKGRIWVQASAPGAFPDWSWKDLDDEGTLEVAFQKEKSMEVRVLAPDGSPAAQVLLRLEGTPRIRVDGSIPALLAVPQGVRHARTDARGIAVIPVPRGEGEWELFVDGGERRGAKPVPGKGTPSRPVEIQLWGESPR